jgi:undecaprenyl-diphosphatase
VSWIQAVVLALLQGVTELFPISSLGHTILITALLGWTDLQNSPSFLPFIVLFHVGTAAALFIYFWRDWVAIIRAFFVTAVAGRIDADPNGRAAWLLVAGTIPAGLIGLFLQTPLKQLFSNPLVAAAFLTINGVVLLVGERARRRAIAEPAARAEADEWVPAGRQGSAQTALLSRPADTAASGLSSFATLSWRDAVLVGLAQALALLPGISRSGVTMVAALRVGMRHEDAAAYTFLLATPIIGAAGLLEIPQLAGSPPSTLVIAIVGGILAGVAAYLSTKFLMRYFENGRLDPFAYYCIAAGLASLAFLAIHP